MTRSSLWVTVAAATALGALSSPHYALAHDPGLSSLNLTLHDGSRAASLQLIVNDADLPQRRRAHAGACDSAGVFALALGREALRAPVRCEASGAHQTRFEASVPLLGPGALQVRVPLLAELPRGHRCFGRVLDATLAVRSERMLDRDAALLQTDVAPPPAAPGFIVLGVEHILTGYDHLLFLAVLLLGVDGLSRMLKLITSFTLAHSASLALSTLGVVRLPGAWVEAAIAASVVWVALRNCTVGRAAGERLWVTFGFGLIHGLGFASVLRDLGVGAAGASVVRPLLQFNLGVELGQLALAALALPVLRHVERAWPVRGLRVISAMAALVGTFWVVERSQALWG